MEVEAPAAAPAEPQPEAVGTDPADGEPMGEATQQGGWFMEKVNTLLVQQVTAAGGPTKWLLGKLDTDRRKHFFTYWLWDTFPEKDDVFYQHQASLEMVKSEEELKNNSNFLSVHPATLGYEPGCTLKPPIGSAKFIAILDQLMIDGFVTGTEPLLINLPDAIHNDRTPPWGASGVLAPHSLGFIKGNARVSTLLALLCFAMDQGFKKADHPALYESVRDIKVVRFSTGGMLGDALLNMKWSVRGSIRTQNNVLQIAIMVQNLQKAGACAISTFVSRWNLQSASSSKITGKRAASLRLLFESAPRDALNDILSHTEDSVGA